MTEENNWKYITDNVGKLWENIKPYLNFARYIDFIINDKTYYKYSILTILVALLIAIYYITKYLVGYASYVVHYSLLFSP